MNCQSRFDARILEAWGWCIEMTQRDGMGRKVGAGFRMGNTCTPVVDACWCMAKPIQYCKVNNNNKLRKKANVLSLYGKLKGKKWMQWQIFFYWAPKSLQTVTAAMKLKTLAPWKESYDKPRQHIKKQRHYFADKGPYSQSYGFSSGHAQMWVRPWRRLSAKESMLSNCSAREDSWESFGQQEDQTSQS